MGLLSLGAGVAIGYVIGTKTGRNKLDAGFEGVKKSAEETWNRPDVQDFFTRTSETTSQLRHDISEGAKKAAAAATDAMKKAEEMVDQAAEQFDVAETKTTHNGDVISDPTQSTQRTGTDRTDEGGFKP